jgi:hypothetical protein
MDYGFELLGDVRFQQLCQALLVKGIGTQCYPVDQPDGGRDAIRRGAGGTFTVFQIKFSREKISGADARDWLLDHATGEVEKVRRLKMRGANEYYLITNAQGSGHLDVGSIDRVQTKLSQLFEMPVTCWWRDDVSRRLDGNWDLKLHYPEVIAGPDALRLILDNALGVRANAASAAVRAYLAEQYDQDYRVKFKQVDLENRLLDLFVDGPFSASLNSAEAELGPWRHMERLGQIDISKRAEADDLWEIETSASPEVSAGAATLLLSQLSMEVASLVVVEGAPGQGKSTLAQYICQTHRIRWLTQDTDLQQLPAAHKTSPLRLPIKVDLRDLATWLSGRDPFSRIPNQAPPSTTLTLETLIVRQIQDGSGGYEFRLEDLTDIAKVTPLLIMLDGFDEVADPGLRNAIVACIGSAATRLKSLARNTQMVITSRPTAFATSKGFDRTKYLHITLDALPTENVLTYAQRWCLVRRLPNKDAQDILDTLRERLSEPHIRELSKNPMQLSILLNLVRARGVALPDKRTSLYDAYVNTFFDREAEKSATIRKYGELLKEIHGYLAFELHCAAENENGSGRIDVESARIKLRDYLHRHGHSTTIVDELFHALRERIVLLVSRVMGTYEFDVQPIREYFSARFLYDSARASPVGMDVKGTKPDRFRALATNPYWFNVTRFFCGCFSRGELMDLAVDALSAKDLEALANVRELPKLWATLVADWVFVQTPRARNEVVAALCTEWALVRLGAMETVFNESCVRMAAECGGQEVGRAALEWAEKNRNSADWARSVVSLAKVNLPDEEVIAWVTDRLERCDRDDLGWYLYVGTATDALGRIEPEVLIRVATRLNALSTVLWRCLLSGPHGFVRSSSDLEAEFVRLYLRTTGGISDGEFKELQLLEGVLEGALTLDNKESYWARNISEVSENIRAERSGKTNIGEVSKSWAPIVEAADVILDKIALPMIDGTLDRKSVAEVLRELERILGPVPRVWCAVCSFSAELPMDELSAIGAAVDDGLSSTLFNFVVAAMFHRNSSDWWLKQLENVATDDGRAQLHALFWVFAGVPQCEAALPAFDADLPQVKRLTPWLGGLYRSVPGDGSGAKLESGVAHLSVEGCLLLWRYRRSAVDWMPEVRRIIAARTAANAWDVSAMVSQCVRSGLMQWDEALPLIRELYQLRSHATLSGLRLTRDKMTYDVANQIARSPIEYPRELWECANDFLMIDWQQKARRVSHTAIDECWFDNSVR